MHLDGDRVKLLSVCLLSVGSHWAVWQLSPLRPTLGSSSTFASSVTAVQLANTVSPLVCGVLIPRYGAARSAIVATALTLVGQLICWRARAVGSIDALLLGLFVSGTAAAPLSVVQETVIVSLQPDGRNLILAFGLLAGKATGFMAAIAALPINDYAGDAAPFAVASVLSAASLAAALLFWRCDARSPSSIAEKHPSFVPVQEIVLLGDAVWTYLAVCAVSGALWFTTTHNSPDMLHVLFGASPRDASTMSSVTLATAIVLYPLLGRVLDRSQGRTVFRLFILTSLATLLTYPMLLLRAPSAFVSLLPFALGTGAAPLLLVVSASLITSRRYVSTVLGLHKSVEISGAIIAETIAGRLNTSASSDESTVSGMRTVAVMLLALNMVHIMLLAYFGHIAHRQTGGSYKPLPESDTVELDDGPDKKASTSAMSMQLADRLDASDASLVRRGRIALGASASLVVAAWLACVVNRAL